MPVTDFRQRTAVLFIAVVLGHIILISAQVNSRAGVPLLEVVTFGAFAEVQRGAAGLTGGIRDAWSGYVNLRGVRAENEQLKQQLGELQVQFQQERAQSRAGARSWRACSGSSSELQVETIPAGVIGAGRQPRFPHAHHRSEDRVTGVATNMAVIAPTGVVGRIVTPTTHASKVQLLIDRNAAAGALVERSRAQGIVVGRGRRAAADGFRRGDGRREGRRHDRDVGHRRDLSEGVRDRQSRDGRQRQRHLQGHSRSSGG